MSKYQLGPATFIQIPMWLVQDETVCAQAKILWCVIHAATFSTGPRQLSHAQLAEMSGVKSITTIRRHLAELESAGALVQRREIGPRGKQKSTFEVTTSSHPGSTKNSVSKDQPKIVDPTSSSEYKNSRSEQVTSEQIQHSYSVAELRSAICEACGLDTTHFSSVEWSRYGKVAKQLQSLEATPDVVKAAVVNYKTFFPSWPLTPHAVVGHWSEVFPRESSNSETRPGQEPRVDWETAWEEYHVRGSWIDSLGHELWGEPPHGG